MDGERISLGRGDWRRVGRRSLRMSIVFPRFNVLSLTGSLSFSDPAFVDENINPSAGTRPLTVLVDRTENISSLLGRYDIPSTFSSTGTIALGGGASSEGAAGGDVLYVNHTSGRCEFSDNGRIDVSTETSVEG